MYRPMSKAFTRENDNAPDEESEEPISPLPQGVKNYITPAGADCLRQELKTLLNTERPKIVDVVAWAASNGDRSENADYIYGKRRLREIDRRIRFLTKRLEIAEIIDPAAQRSDRVVFGASVTVRGEKRERLYRIVGIDETDVKRGHISWISPVGKALLRARVGDSVTIHTPGGDEELEVIAIRYEPFD